MAIVGNEVGALVGAATGEYCWERLQEDHHVEAYRPALEVDKVKADKVVELKVGSAGDLPKAGDARKH